MLQTGARVRVKNDPAKIGIVTGATKVLGGGREFVQLELAGGELKWILPAQLEPYEALADALGDYAAGRFSAPGDLAQILTHVRLTGDLADLIYSMEATNTEFHAFQFKPVIKVLNSAAKGLLIADEVGLGKTIEAGLVWTELEARYDVERLLIVCPKSLQEKWRHELRSKFGARARAVDARELLDALKERDEHGGDFVLVATLPGLRAPAGWDEPDADLKTGRAQLARYLREREGGEPLFDMVVFDEAHHLRNPSTAQHRTARMIVDLADYKLMLSATPINLKNEDLRSILRLIEPELFDREWIFEELQMENEPIVAARELVLNRKVSLAEVATALAAIEPGVLLRTDRRLEILRAQLGGDTTTDNASRRVEIASRLEEMSMLGGVVNRTRRRDVAEIQVKRRATSRSWEMTEEEGAFYAAATEAIRDYAWRNGLSEGFLLANSQRLLASSLPAAYHRWNKAVAYLGLEGDDLEEREQDKAPGPLVAALAECCRDADGAKRLAAADSKLSLLQQALAETWAKEADEKLIIFSSFQGTLDYLEARLAEAGVACFKMHGGVATERSALVSEFRDAQGAAVLLTSEVGGEGLDLQFCRVLINYDLPWNPMRVEQRVGRIDRIGQRSPSVEVINLICQGTIEARIYERLYERLGLIERTLGGFEPILGPIVAGLEGRLLDPRLRAEEVDEELDRAATAAEQRKRIADDLEKEAAGLIAHGDMILQRIKRAHEQQRWIQPAELYAYVRAGLDAAFPGSTLDRTNHPFEAYELRMSAPCQQAFREFVDQRAKRADTLLRRGEPVTLVFGKRPDGVRDARIESVMPTHPLVRFLAKVREDNSRGLAARPALTGRLQRSALSEPPLAGFYGLVIQRWAIGGATPQDKLVYGGADLATGALLSEDDAEGLMLAALEGLQPRDVPLARAAEEAAALRQYVVDSVLSARHDEFISLDAAIQEDKRETLLAVLRRQLDSHRQKIEARILSYQSRGGGYIRMVPPEKGKLARYVARMQAKIHTAEASATFSFDEPQTLGVCVVELY